MENCGGLVAIVPFEEVIRNCKREARKEVLFYAKRLASSLSDCALMTTSTVPGLHMPPTLIPLS